MLAVNIDSTKLMDVVRGRFEQLAERKTRLDTKRSEPPGNLSMQ